MVEIEGSIRLRKLAPKSILDFGKYEGYTVQQVIDLGRVRYLIWCYFALSKISFIEDLLEFFCIDKDHRIEKPGKAEDDDIQGLAENAYSVYYQKIRDCMSEEEYISHINQVRGLRNKRKNIKNAGIAIKASVLKNSRLTVSMSKK